MKTIKLLITSILLLSSIQAYSIENLYASSPETRGIKVEIEGKDGKPAPESVTIISSNARSQFTLSGLVLTLKRQDFDTMPNNPITIITKHSWGGGVRTQLFRYTFTITDVDDEAPTMQLSNSTILTGSPAYSMVGDVVANDVDSDNSKLSYRIGGADKEHFVFSASKQLIMKNKVDIAVKSHYSIEIHVTDPAGNSTSNKFTITVEPNLAITTTDISTPENADKVINLTTNRGEADFLITGGEDENKFSLSGTTLTFKATDFEARDDKTYSVEIAANRAGINGGANEHAAKTITVTVTDLNDEAPTDIQINDAVFIDDKVVFTNDKGANFLLGTLSAADIDTAAAAMTFTTTSAHLKIVNNNELRTKRSITVIGSRRVTITASDGTQSIDKTFVIKVVPSSQVLPPEITNTDVSVVENSSTDIPLLTIAHGSTDKSIQYDISGRDKDFFNLKGNVVSFKNSPDYERKPSYSLILEIKNGSVTRAKTITITIINIKEKTISIVADQTMSVNERSQVNTPVGTVATTGIVTGFEIIAGNSNNFFKISPTGKIQVAGAGLNYESRQSYTLIVKITDDDAESKTAKIIVQINRTRGAGTPEDRSSAFFITTNNVSTPENTSKVITLAVNKGLAVFKIMGGDTDKFTLSGSSFMNYNKLTFKATALEDGNDATYRITIRATQVSAYLSPPFPTDEQTLVVTVTNNPDNDGKFHITTADAFSTPENTNKVIALATNNKDPLMSDVFEIIDGEDANKFTLKGDELTFKATAFKARSDATYRVNIKATKVENNAAKSFVEAVEKTLTVTVIDPNTVNTNAAELPETARAIAKATARAVRKESKTASKTLLTKTGKTLRARLSHIRHKNQQKSSFSANGFVSGIQVSFADSQTNSFINRVLSANGLSNVIPISSRKVERWDIWTKAKVVIGKSSGSGANKTKFNLKSLNIGMDRRIAQDKTIGFALGLGKQDRTATGIDFSGDVDTKQYTLSSYGALELSNKGSIEAVLGVAKATHKVGKSNTLSADQGSNGFFASIAYRADLQAQSVDLSPFIRYDISRIKMKANDVLTNSETATDEAIALGIDISKTGARLVCR